MKTQISFQAAGRAAMLWTRIGSGKFVGLCAVLIIATMVVSEAAAETCKTTNEMDEATRSALTTTAQRYFDLIAKGDAASIRQNTIPSVAADFSGIETTIKDNQPALAGSRGIPRPPFLLDAEGTAPLARAEFYCGVFGKSGQTRDSAVFYLNNLPPAKYAVVIMDSPTAKGAYSVSFVLQQQGSAWKMGGLYIKPSQAAGHDSDWYAARAREFKAKGQAHNAWLYYLEARALISPLPFMSTAVTDKLYDESQSLKPADFPADGTTANLAAGGANYKLTAIFPEAVANDLDLVVRYEARDISNTNQTYQTNVTIMKAFLTKYPELRDTFTAVVVRAVNPAGQDFGTLMAMKDIK